MIWLLVLLLMAGCIGDYSQDIEKALKIYGMDVQVSDDYTITWEPPGTSPYDIIYGIYLIRGTCLYYEIPLDQCTLKIKYGNEILWTTTLDKFPGNTSLE